MILRDATRADFHAIVAIYNASIPERMATADLEPVTLESRRGWFEAHSPQTHPLIVAADTTGEVMGWGSLSVFYGRVAYRHTAEISVYISPAHTRKGVGAALTQELLRRSPTLGIKTLLAYIFGHNEPSIRLFEKFGFTKWGQLPDIADLDGQERDLVIYGLRVAK